MTLGQLTVRSSAVFFLAELNSRRILKIMKLLQTIFAALFIFILVVTPVLAGKDVRKYEIPDVREVYCGAEVAPYYCKCAFHNQQCKAREISQDAAFEYVLSGFQDWNRQKIQAVAEQCLKGDGYWDKSDWECTYCTEGDVLSGKKCVAPKKIDPEVAECSAAIDNFDTQWDKYSDFDDRLGNDVSYEVQQFNVTLDAIGLALDEVEDIEYALALEEEFRIEMRAYKEALVMNIRQNITKAIFRLAWVTYNTTKSAYGGKGSIEKLLDPGNNIEVAGATMKLIQSHIPPDAKSLQFDTTTTSGKLKSIAWNATLEVMESSADPASVVKQGMKDLKSAAVGGPDITPEEVAILRTQHLDNDAVTKAIADSHAESAQLRVKLYQEGQVVLELYDELQEWKFKEQERVLNNLEEQCKDKI